MNKKIIIGIISVVIVLIIGCILFLTLNKKEDETLKINSFKDESIKMETIISNDDKLIIKTSSTDKIDLLDFDIAFYNKNELLKTKDAFIKNLNKNEQIIVVDLPLDEEDKALNITKIDIKAINNKFDASNIEDVKEKITTETKENEDSVELLIKSSIKEQITELSLTTIFYKENKIISAKTSYVVGLDKEKKLNITKPYELKDGEITYLNYDKVEVIINHAIKNK